jgi:hypothetical protein
MTRAELLARIEELKARLANYVPDPLKSEEEQRAAAVPIAASLAAFQERLRRLDLHR